MVNLNASIVLLFFMMVIVSSNAVELHAELYWKSKFGNITIPKVLKDSLIESDNGLIKLTSGQQTSPNQTPLYFYKYGIGNEQENPVPKDGHVLFLTNETLSTVGTKLKLHFAPMDDGSKFLPFHMTKSMTVTSDRLKEILKILSINPKSVEAKSIAKTIEECESKGVEGEIKYCAPSLEAMVDYVTSLSSLKHVKLMLASTEAKNNALMEYTIQKTKKISHDDKHNMICHKLSNPFVVFLCHTIKNTDTYDVLLVGADGKQMNAVAVCHKDTSKWHPKHISFKLLNLKPGKKPICHFLSVDTVAWIQK